MSRVDSPPEIATRLGHCVVWDPPVGAVSFVERWTCLNCHRAVLRFRGNIYGSAITGDCKPVI